MAIAVALIGAIIFACCTYVISGGHQFADWRFFAHESGSTGSISIGESWFDADSLQLGTVYAIAVTQLGTAKLALVVPAILWFATAVMSGLIARRLTNTLVVGAAVALLVAFAPYGTSARASVAASTFALTAAVALAAVLIEINAGVSGRPRLMWSVARVLMVACFLVHDLSGGVIVAQAVILWRTIGRQTAYRWLVQTGGLFALVLAASVSWGLMPAFHGTPMSIRLSSIVDVMHLVSWSFSTPQRLGVTTGSFFIIGGLILYGTIVARVEGSHPLGTNLRCALALITCGGAWVGGITFLAVLSGSAPVTLVEGSSAWVAFLTPGLVFVVGGICWLVALIAVRGVGRGDVAPWVAAFVVAGVLAGYVSRDMRAADAWAAASRSQQHQLEQVVGAVNRAPHTSSLFLVSDTPQFSTFGLPLFATTHAFSDAVRYRTHRNDVTVVPVTQNVSVKCKGADVVVSDRQAILVKAAWSRTRLVGVSGVGACAPSVDALVTGPTVEGTVGEWDFEPTNGIKSDAVVPEAALGPGMGRGVALNSNLATVDVGVQGVSFARSFTVSVWMRTLARPDSNETVLMLGSYPKPTFRLGFIQNDTLDQFAFTLGAGPENARVQIDVESGRVADGKWHYISASLHDGTLYLSIDGRSVKRSLNGSRVAVASGDRLAIGHQTGCACNSFNGLVDHVTVSRSPSNLQTLLRGFRYENRETSRMLLGSD